MVDNSLREDDSTEYSEEGKPSLFYLLGYNLGYGLAWLLPMAVGFCIMAGLGFGIAAVVNAVMAYFGQS